ncbi:hypothetical protein BDV10DRAFT_188485 [Aspergillus recurvatus]
MAELSIGLFQEDEVMEKSLVNLPDSTTKIVARYIDELCHETAVCTEASLHGPLSETSISGFDEQIRTRLKNIQHNVRLWLHFVLNDNLPANTSSRDKRDLQQEVKMAMLAALQQAKAQKSLNSRQAFYTWLHTCAVHDVKSAVISKFLIPKIGQGANVFCTAKEKYLAERLWRQMSIEDRLWNDFGSIEETDSQRISIQSTF